MKSKGKIIFESARFMSTMDNKQFQWWFLSTYVYCHSFFYSLNARPLQSGGGSHQLWNHFLQTLSLLRVDWIVCYDIWNTNPSCLWSQCSCGIKIRKTSLFIYIFCIFINPPFFCISKGWVQRQMSLAPLILKDLTWLTLAGETQPAVSSSGLHQIT